MMTHVDLDPLLAWLAAGHFVFLGAATYDLGPDGPVCRPGSAMGQLSAEDEIDPEIDIDGPTVSVSRAGAFVHHPPVEPNDRRDVADRRRRTSCGRTVRRAAGLDRLPPERARDSVGRRPCAGRARARQGGRRDAHGPFDAQRARDVAARPGVRARCRPFGAARDRRGRVAGASDRARVRRARTGGSGVDGARVRTATTVHGPAARAGGRAGRCGVRVGHSRGRVVPRLEQPGPHHVHRHSRSGEASRPRRPVRRDRHAHHGLARSRSRCGGPSPW